MTAFKSDFLNTLQERGFIHQCSDFEGLDALAARNLYLDRLENTYGLHQVAMRIESFRDETPSRVPPRAFPH